MNTHAALHWRVNRSSPSKVQRSGQLWLSYEQEVTSSEWCHGDLGAIVLAGCGPKYLDERSSTCHASDDSAITWLLGHFQSQSATQRDVADGKQDSETPRRRSVIMRAQHERELTLWNNRSWRMYLVEHCIALHYNCRIFSFNTIGLREIQPLVCFNLSSYWYLTISLFCPNISCLWFIPLSNIWTILTWVIVEYHSYSAVPS